MKLPAEKRTRPPKAGDLVNPESAVSPILFNPEDLLGPEDFACMLPEPVVESDKRKLAQNLAISLLFFPEKKVAVQKSIEEIKKALDSQEIEKAVSEKRESFLFAVALLKQYLPQEKLRAWTKTAWKEYKQKRRPAHDLVEIMKVSLAVRMVCPEKTDEVETYLNHWRDEAERRTELGLAQLDIEHFNSLALICLAFPEMRQNIHLEPDLFARVEKNYDRFRRYQNPLASEDVSFFPAAMLSLAILGNPEAKITETGELNFSPSKKVQKQTPLPPRNEV